MDTAVVQELADLAPRIKEGHNNAAGMRTAVADFEKLSQRMAADNGLAARLAKTPLPSLLSKFILAQPAPDCDMEVINLFIENITHLCMVGSRLAASGGPALDRLFAARFPQILATILLNTRALPADMARHQLTTTFLPLISTLTAIVTSNHAQTNKALATHDNFAGMLHMAEVIYAPGEWKNDVDYDIMKNLTKYLWTLASTFAETGDFGLDLEDMVRLTTVLKFWSDRTDIPKPAFYDALSAADKNDWFGVELVVLHHTAQILKVVFTPADRIGAMSGVLTDFFANSAHADTLLSFVETKIEGTKCGQPEWVIMDNWDEQTRKGVLSIRAGSRDCAAQAVAGSAVAISFPAAVQTRITGWLEEPELVGYALVAFANSCQDDAAAAEMLAPPSTLPQKLASLLVPGAPLPIVHAVFGLLRNLTVPAENIPRLGKPVLAGVLAVLPWDKENVEKNPALPAYAGAIVKGFVTRGAEYAAQFFADIEKDNKKNVGDLLTLYVDTRDMMMRAKIWDMWSAAVRFLAPVRDAPPAAGSELDQAWQLAAGPVSFTILPNVLRDAPQSPVILGDAVKAIRHIVENGPVSVDGTPVVDNMAQSLQLTAAGEGNGMRGLVDILAAPAANQPTVTPEMQADALAIVKAVNIPMLTDLVKEAVGKSRAAGRPVAAGVDAL